MLPFRHGHSPLGSEERGQSAESASHSGGGEAPSKANLTVRRATHDLSVFKLTHHSSFQASPDDLRIRDNDDSDCNDNDATNNIEEPAAADVPTAELSIATYVAPSVAPSDPLPSSSGMSFTTVTAPEAIPQRPRPRTTSRLCCTGLLDHWQVLSISCDDQIRQQPFEIEGWSEPPSPLPTRYHGPLSWRLVFSWDESEQHSDAEPLRRPKSGSVEETIGDGSVDDTETAPTGSTISLPDDVGDEAVQRCWRLVFELEEFYLQEHPQMRPPSRRTSRATTPKPAQNARSSRGTTRGSRLVPILPRRQRRLAGGAEDNDDDDDESSDDNPKSAPGPSAELSEYISCPFLKWRPRFYEKSCKHTFRDFYAVKKHLRLSHRARTCTHCLRVFKKSSLLEHIALAECRNLPPRPREQLRDVITMEQWDIVFSRPKGRISAERQWRNIFDTLFPGAQQPSSIYDTGDGSKLQASVEAFAQGKGSRRLRLLQGRNASDDPTCYMQGVTRASESAEVWERFAPHMFHNYRSLGTLPTGSSSSASTQALDATSVNTALGPFLPTLGDISQVPAVMPQIRLQMAWEPATSYGPDIILARTSATGLLQQWPLSEQTGPPQIEIPAPQLFGSGTSAYDLYGGDDSIAAPAMGPIMNDPFFGSLPQEVWSMENTESMLPRFLSHDAGPHERWSGNFHLDAWPLADSSVAAEQTMRPVSTWPKSLEVGAEDVFDTAW
ncbi:hypothetical protein B0T14DRAFT_571989 [Immersiella caudata]|uniref:C2H2-type domain-containing protein n=1 Tax=Immersiella caudata TaxID=314043 RepID=A0AA39WAL4_9PEZI|nr:hypothetical protein B0T14DRAFT_571989 [Immersiella caudata]